jgi:hypothetical protein
MIIVWCASGKKAAKIGRPRCTTWRSGNQYIAAAGMGEETKAPRIRAADGNASS